MDVVIGGPSAHQTMAKAHMVDHEMTETVSDIAKSDAAGQQQYGTHWHQQQE